jgi:endonuclease-3
VRKTRIQKSPSKNEIKKARQILKILNKKYGSPEWRQPLSPVDELVSTILSQNTNDINRDRAFENLRATFPTWEEVRDASETDIIKAVRVAGLANQKGPRIQSVLRKISREQGNITLDFLRNSGKEEAYNWLVNQKGIGPKTASIVLQFSLGIPAFPVDTHIYRVSGRTGIRPDKMNVEQAHSWMEKLFTSELYGPGHLNIIRFGREICHARKPECSLCSISHLCDYFQTLP